MTNPNDPTEPSARSGDRPPSPIQTEWAGALQQYMIANRGRYTDEALMAAALAVGYSEADARAALELAIDDQAARPVRSRARRVVTVLYLASYGLLVAGMLTGRGSYGEGWIGTGILTVTLGIAYLIARLWLGRRLRAASVDGALPVLLSVPVILWFVVSGLCVATGLPFSWLTGYPLA